MDGVLYRETDTGKCEYEKDVFNKIKHVFCEYEDLWYNLRDMGTGICSAMRSIPYCASVNAYEDIGEIFIADVNCDIYQSKLLAFHYVLHIISLDVQDSIKHLPENWIKHARLLCIYFE